MTDIAHIRTVKARSKYLFDMLSEADGLKRNEFLQVDGPAASIGSDNNYVAGTGNDDWLFADAGNDVIAQNHYDEIYFYWSSQGAVIIDGKEGYDTLRAEINTYPGPERVTLNGIRSAPYYRDFTLAIDDGSGGSPVESLVSNIEKVELFLNYTSELVLKGDFTSMDIHAIFSSNRSNVVDLTGLYTDVLSPVRITLSLGDDLVRLGGNHSMVWLEGGEGVDMLDYSAVAASVLVDLAAGTVHCGDEPPNTDPPFETPRTIYDFENINGSSYSDFLFGDAGANVIDGWEGADELDGRGGDDLLIGGGSDDIFVFRAGFGHDRIRGFELSGTSEAIKFESALFADFDAVLAASQQVGEDVVITYDGANTLILEKVLLSNLSSDDFRFA